MATRRTLFVIDRACRAFMALTPVALRSRYASDLALTLRDICIHAYERRGWPGLVLAGMTELGSVGGSAMRAALGQSPRITGGEPPSGASSSRRVQLFATLRRDLRLAGRTLAASKLASAVAIGTLALGIGINAAVFSILDSTILRPVPFADADRLGEIWNLNEQSKFSYPGFTPALLRAWRAQTDLFDRVEGFDVTSFVFDASSGAEMVTGAVVTPGLLPMLGVPPIAGRLFAADDGRGDTAARVIISERFWSASLGRRPDIVGQHLVLNDQQYTVIGIMPGSFRFPGEGTVFWVPFNLETSPPASLVRSGRLTAFTRRQPGLSQPALDERVRERGLRLATAAGISRPVAAVSSNRSWTRDLKTQRSLVVLGGAVVFLLIIVCANLASLSLSRTLARARDCAVRAALGASRADLIRETMVENLAIGAIGAIAGVGVAAAALGVTVRWLPTAFTHSSMNAIDLDARMLIFTAACGIVTALLFGLAPALLASRAGVAGLLARGSRSTTGSPASRRLRSALVVVEVALAIVLLVGAALMTRSFIKLQHVDRGFDVSGLVAMRLGLPASRYTDPYARDAFVDEMVNRSARLAGVRSSTSGGVPPDSNIISFGKLEFAHRPGTLSEELDLPVYQVWPNYFTSVGIPIRAGRSFAADEPRESVVVSESFARAFWPGGDALGARFRFEGSTSWRTIVGIAAEVRQFDLDDANGSFEFYYPLRRPPGLPAPTAPATAAIIDYRTIVVRTSDVEATMSGLRQLVHEVDPRVVIWRLDPVERLFAEAIARPRIVLLLMAVFASLGLILAAAGIYAVLSHLVAQRRREIGLRLALGARPESIRRLVVGNGLTLTAVGLVIGVPAALGFVRLMRTLLYDVATSDPWSLTAVVAIVTSVAALASWWPARRAAGVDPVGLLRED